MKKPHLWVVLISADAEWKAVIRHFPSFPILSSPFGGYLQTTYTDQPVIFFQGGWGKIAAAASAQYAIDTFHPTVLVNLGTCGGFHGYAEPGEVLLAEETLIYDIIELMGDPHAATEHYHTHLDLSWLPKPPIPVRKVRLISADRDIHPEEIYQLASKYQAVGADWESGAIAWVATRNHLPCLILRVVTDVVSIHGDTMYGNYAAFEREAESAMKFLLESFPGWITQPSS